MVYLEDLMKPLTTDQLVDYITGRKIMETENDQGIVMLKINGIGYDYSDSEVMELYGRYNNGELTDEQMTFHLYVLFTLALRIKENRREYLSKSKRQLIDYYNGILSYRFADVPLSKEEIKAIETFFKEPIAAC